MRAALIRHFPTAIAPGLCYGRLDLAPGDGDVAALRDGIAQAGLDTAPIVSSPARRCRALAEALADGRSITFDDRLLELDFGDWEGLPWDDIPRAALDAWAADVANFAPPGGESGAALLARVTAFHAALDGDSVVIGHAGPLKLLAALLRGDPPDLLAPSQPMGALVLAPSEEA
ncbi:histidine phosphatase family protein [Roseomonas sp. 18066]|uniref:histidine phosphatase family protein n=1 Tax=Roseomonas sp. 18066 TaxID=2681412 RepID=UPI001356EC8D|nr:histidine phosphatase family protein [Roseomonas sp. 18066]